MPFPVSIKGVLIERNQVVLLLNERDQWELPGGRLEPGEDPQACLAREINEELGTDVDVVAILDCWLYEILPGREVVIVTYGVRRVGEGPLTVSQEHQRLQWFDIGEIGSLAMPEGYRRSIRAWAGSKLRTPHSA